jgi:endo-1,4-beta-xylanase
MEFTGRARRQFAQAIESLEPRRMMAAVRLFSSVTNAIENSGQPLVVTVVRDAASVASALTVNLTYTGSAIAGTDYAAAPASITIPANQRFANLSISTLNDSVFTPARTLNVNLAPGSGYTLDAASTRIGRLTIRDDEMPTGSVSVISAPAAGDFSFWGPNATRSVVAVTGQPFTSANRVVVNPAPANVWDVQLATQNTIAINTGDVMFLQFFARTTAAGASGQIQAVFEQNQSPWTKSLITTVSVSGNTWQAFYLPFSAAIDYGLPGGTGAVAAQLSFQLGSIAQSIEIAGVQLSRFPAGVNANDLPQASQTYQGRSGSDLSWRDAAEARVEQIRKGNQTIEIVDTSGNLISGATVRALQTEHQFGFGTAVAHSALFNPNATQQSNYRQLLLKYFNSRVVAEWEMKWPAWETYTGWTFDMMNWFAANGIDKVRGHNLVWPNWDLMPASAGSTYGGINYRSDPNKPDAQEEYEAHVTVDGQAAARTWLRNRVNNHITSIAGNAAIKGKITEWDVVNEAVYNRDVQNALGNNDAELVQWFNRAKQTDPNAKMYLNDYPPMDRGSHLDRYFDQLQYLKNSGAAIEGLGFQSHFNQRTPNIADMQATFDRFAALGLTMQVTEFDSTLSDEQLRADFMRDYALLAFSQPGVDAFLHWGFWAGSHWLPEAALFDMNFNPRPHGQVWMDLMDSIWKSDVTTTTTTNGRSTPRLFFGDYRITVNYNGLSANFTRTLGSTTTGPTRLTIADNVAPAVASSSDSIDAGFRADFDFTENVSSSISAADITVRNLTTNVNLPASAWTFSTTNVAGKTKLIVRLNGVPANGNYRVSLNGAGITDLSGNAMTAAASRTFFVLNGDANRDRVVNFGDLLVLASNYDRTGMTYGQGDFNFDGRVDFGDLLLLASNYETALPAAVIEPASARQRRRVSRSISIV